MLIPKQEIIRDEKYRRWLVTLGCVITGHTDCQAAHIRIGSLAGLARKPSDDRCLPLFWMEHSRQHEMGELKFWYEYGGWERAVVLAKALYKVRFDDEAAHEIINNWRK